MKQTLIFIFLILGNFQPVFANDTLYWSFSSNSTTKKITECSKIKESDMKLMIKEMGCLKAFSSGVLFCSEKRVVYLFPDEKQCAAQQSKVKFTY